MATIAILKGDKPNQTSEAYKTFRSLEQVGGDDYSLILYRDLVFEISQTGADIVYQGKSLKEFDLVYIRDFQGYEHERNTVALFLQKHGIRFLNQDVAQFQHLSKLSQYMTYSFNGLPIPHSWYGSGEEFLTTIAEKNAFPLIVKSITANSGNDNFVVHDKEQLFATFKDHGHKKLIIQEAIQNEGDYRLIVLGDSVSCVYYRKAQAGDHRNNISQGGEKQYLALSDVPEGLIALAVAAAKAVNREICGVDIMVHSGTQEPVVLEANFNFGIRAIDGTISDEIYGLAEYLHTQAHQE